MGKQTESERWFAEYARMHGYAAQFEPDWVAVFDETFRTNPDFRVTRDGQSAVAEVQDFESRALSEFMGKYRPRGGSVPPAVLQKPLLAALQDKSRQLLPFAATGVPLIIVLTNTGASDVVLDDHQMQTAIFGDMAVSIPIHRDDADVVSDEPPRLITQPGFGAFCATGADGNPCNPRPHISGVAVLHQVSLATEFTNQDLARTLAEQGAEDHQDRLRVGAEWLDGDVAQGRAVLPEGYEYGVTYFDLNRWPLGHGPPVPDGWFTGPRDRRFVFDEAGEQYALIERDSSS